MNIKRPWTPIDNSEDELYRANLARLTLESKATEMAEIFIEIVKHGLYDDLLEKIKRLLIECGYQG